MTVTPLDAEAGGAVVTWTDVTELEQAKAALEESLRQVRELKERLEAENVVLQQEVRGSGEFEEIVGRSPALVALLGKVQRVAATDAPVLVLGETGTGKDLVARAVHDRSPRRGRPLVTVNCAALPPSLIESELFGYEKGAFTGAITRTPGRFEVADGGTILLDEVGELPLEVQAKLLRVLQTGEFERLGSSKVLRTDVRLVAATNRDLEREVREGRFRADLFYRLSVFPLTLPPLRSRPEDIPLLVWHVIARKQARLGRHIERVTDRAMRAFRAYSWPGNIRELENVVERALILSTGAVLTIDPLFPGTRRGRFAAHDRPAVRGRAPAHPRRARAVRLEGRRQGQRGRAAGPQPLHPPVADEEARDQATPVVTPSRRHEWPWRRYARTTGPATCVSCRTWWTARSSCPMGSCSGWMLLRYNIVTERETAGAFLHADAHLSTRPTRVEDEKGQWGTFGRAAAGSR